MDLLYLLQITWRTDGLYRKIPSIANKDNNILQITYVLCYSKRKLIYYIFKRLNFQTKISENFFDFVQIVTAKLFFKLFFKLLSLSDLKFKKLRKIRFFFILVISMVLIWHMQICRVFFAPHKNLSGTEKK